MTVPHDPAIRAHLTYTWRDEHYYLITKPRPLVSLRSDRSSIDTPYESQAAAEDAFWAAVVGSILAARAGGDPYARWGHVELAAVRDPRAKTVHLVERTLLGSTTARVLDPSEQPLVSFKSRLRELIEEAAV